MNIHVFADESGHSGKQIFNAPEYYHQSALFIPENEINAFDEFIRKWCNILQVSRIHAKDLPTNVRADIFNELSNILNTKSFHILTVIIEKTFIPALKVVDSFFDPWENFGARHMWYVVAHFRHALCLVIDRLLSYDEKKKFYFGYLADDRNVYKSILETLLDGAESKPMDGRLRLVMCEAFEWALHNMDKMTINHVTSRKSYQGNTPNMIAFSALLHEMKKLSAQKSWKIKRFVHDEQNEFKSTMLEWKDMFRDKYLEHNYFNGIELFPKIAENSVPINQFDIVSSNNEILLQVVDIFLWHKAKKIDCGVMNQTDFYISRAMSESIVAHGMNNVSAMNLSKKNQNNGMKLYLEIENKFKHRKSANKR